MKIQSHSNAAKFTRTIVAAFFSALALLSACNTNERVSNSEALASEIKAAKIRRITGAELDEMMLTSGKKIAGIATQALEKDTLPGNCTPTASQPVFDLLKKKTGAGLTLVFLRDTASTFLSAKEKELLRAYQYEAGKGSTLSSELQKLNDTLSVFYSPVDKSSALFRNCPDATASPFVLWRVELNQKKVIQTRD